MSDFYIGYLPKAPKVITRRLRRIVALLFLTAAMLATLLVVAQQPFTPAVFEWQSEREFRGTIEARPYPTLVVERPGQAAAEDRYSRYLLVGLGKHGAAQDVAVFEGMSVRLRGKLIYRAENTMIEVMPNSVVLESPSELIQSANSEKIVTIHGEIVDSKCFSGVMNPGRGKVHRDCAARCLSGGVPPLLVESESPNRLILLTSSAGGLLSPAMFLDRVAEPIVARGQLITRGDRLELRVESIIPNKEPGAWR
ncbi:MAG TPA: hypothetical protein VF135_05410 [Terriglobales bacterium]